MARRTIVSAVMALLFVGLSGAAQSASSVDGVVTRVIPFHEQFEAIEQIARSAAAGLWSGKAVELERSQAVQPPPADIEEPQQVVVDFGPRTTGLYHRADCAWMRGLTTTRTFTIAEAKKRYFQPHCHCVHGEDKTPPCPHVAKTPAQAATAQTPSATTPASRVAPEAPRAVPATPKPVPQTVTRCQAITKKGTQCLRNAQPGRSFCWQH